MHAYHLATGQKAWTSPPMDYPWSQPGFGSYDATSAYGMLFRQAYDGVYAFDWDDGSIVWHYKAPTPVEFETPYIDSEGKGVYSFNGASMVADGKLYTYNTEHTATQPITRGWSIHCIDVFTGEGIWNMTGGISQGAVADGYLTASSSYTGETIVFGKGKSATTVSAPQTQIPVGQSFMITGTVLDQSPAQSNTPCVSAASMTTQMEYLHMQRPIDGIKGDAVLTGVPVTLTAISTDGSECVDIGTTTTEGYYGTFGFAWTPTKEGTYEIVASFAGDDSYGSSAAATYLVVGPAVSPSEPIEPEPQPTPEPLISTEIAIALVVVAVVAIGAVAFILLRRRE
jgi:outer membrane protein assembly factor BamB